MRVISPTVARRLAITGQRLAGPRLAPTAEGIIELFRQLGCIQLDPTNVVAPTHRLVLWSRLGDHDPAVLEHLRWETRQLFEYWAHAASIVMTEDYPIHRRLMLDWNRGTTPWIRQFRLWVTANSALRRHVVSELRRRGPLPASEFEDRSVRAWRSSGWTAGRNIDRMLSFLWVSGVVVVAGRQGGKRWWELAERWLPAWTPKERLGQREVVRRATQRLLRALGVARQTDIARHFIPDRYEGLSEVLASLERSGIVLPVRIEDQSERWPGRWLIHADDVPVLEPLEREEWQPRTTLLSPFDNLIRDRARTRLMFGFDYTIEIYVPAARRKYGYYVLPILDGDRFIGRIDAAVDRKQNALLLRAVHSEDGRLPRESGVAAAGTIRKLATFVGAKDITPTGIVPSGWKPAFRRAF